MEPIRIRSVQHYLYCPHRWGLIEIDQAWAENAYVVKGNSLHKKAEEYPSYLNKQR
jgi:CRISPR-associated exonuclease Cas4